jgi:HD-like signal output (HDOD) protein
VTVYSVGVVRPVAAGDALLLASGAWYFVIEGPLELRATIGGNAISLALVGRGECFEAPDAAPDVYRLFARDAASLVEISASAVDLLPAATHRALGRIVASSSARRFDALVARHASAAGRNTHLVSMVKQAPARARRILALPEVQKALAEIPALPIQLTELATALLDEGSHTKDLAESIKNDPALAGRVLKRVNSAYYGLETKVADHYRALLLLGTATVYQLILETAVDGVIPDDPESHDIQVRATLTSVLAYEIALASGRVNPLLASTIGLLHNIGDGIALLIRRAQPETAELVGCVESASLGAAVLTAWGLPERVGQIVERQEEPPLLLPEELGANEAELAVLYLARVCHDVLLERATPPAAAAAYMTYLGLRDADCMTFCRETLRPALAKKAESLPASVRKRLAR